MSPLATRALRRRASRCAHGCCRLAQGNFRTLRTAVDSALDVRAFRYLVVSSQYRAGLNFSPEVHGDDDTRATTRRATALEANETWLLPVRRR